MHQGYEEKIMLGLPIAYNNPNFALWTAFTMQKLDICVAKLL